MTDEPRNRDREGPGEPAPVITSMQGTGIVLYLTGAMLAFCGFPQFDDGLLLPLRGWAGVLGAILLGVSPRAGVIRSLGLIGLWISGLFLGKNPIVFVLGASLLLTGIALFNHRPPEPPANANPEEEEWYPLDAGAERTDEPDHTPE